jgi:glycosyltransferase involved in cell wall biosynthesis
LQKKLGIVIAMYNESNSIKEVLQTLKVIRSDDTIIVVDDGSKDDCYSIASEVDGIHLLKHCINLGQGAALQTGIEYAKRLGMDYVLTYDADGQHDPHDIEPFKQEMLKGDYDIILGSRFLGTTVNMKKSKYYVLKLSIWFGYLFGGLKLTDSHNGFRLINIKKFPSFEMEHNEMAHASEVIDIIKANNLSYKEMPCTIKYTDYSVEKGQSVFNSINIMAQYLIGKIK